MSHYTDSNMVSDDTRSASNLRSRVDMFDGKAGTFAKFRAQLIAMVSEKGEDFPMPGEGRDWAKPVQKLFALKNPELEVLIAADLHLPEFSGRSVGDLKLTMGNWIKYTLEKKKWTSMRQSCVSILSNAIPEGSFIHGLIKEPFEEKNLSGIMDILVELFQGEHWHVVLAIAANWLYVLEDSSPQSSLAMKDRMDKFFIQYTDLMNVTSKKDRLESAEQFNIRVLNARCIWDMMIAFIKMSHTSVQKEMVTKLIDSEFMKNNRPPSAVSIPETWASFRAQAATMPVVIPKPCNLVSYKSDASLEAELKLARSGMHEANKKR